MLDEITNRFPNFIVATVAIINGYVIFHYTLYHGCNYVSIPGLRFIHVNKMAHGILWLTLIKSSICHNDRCTFNEFAKHFFFETCHCWLPIISAPYIICLSINILMCVYIYLYILFNPFVIQNKMMRLLRNTSSECTTLFNKILKQCNNYSRSYRYFPKFWGEIIGEICNDYCWLHIQILLEYKLTQSNRNIYRATYHARSCVWKDNVNMGLNITNIVPLWISPNIRHLSSFNKQLLV